MTYLRGILAAVLMTVALPAASQQQTSLASGEAAQRTATELSRAGEEMHRRMSAASGDSAEEVYVRRLIEHHRGAVEMSRIALQHIRDSELRRKAQMTIDEQEKEIGDLQSWLNQHVSGGSRRR
jgi:uncharacterized protein (DUF305 family)